MIYKPSILSFSTNMISCRNIKEEILFVISCSTINLVIPLTVLVLIRFGS